MATSPSRRSQSEPLPAGSEPRTEMPLSGSAGTGAGSRAEAEAGITPAPVPAPAPAADPPPVPMRPARLPVTSSATSDDCVRVVEWLGGEIREWRGFGELRRALSDPAAIIWVDLTDPSAEHVAQIAHLMGLHPLIAEDILEGNQRAKIEVTDELCHIVMFALEYRGEMLRSEIDFVLGATFLLTVHEASWDPRTTTHLREGLGPIMRRGPDHLLWALVDALVDSYFPFIDRMGDEVDEIEDEVVVHATSRVLSRLFQLKKDLLTARRAAAPVREIFNQLTNRDLALIDREEVVYFRDVYDHLIRLTDELDNYRELVSSALDVYLSTINNNLSLIMKRLTGVTVILAGIGAVAGIFGMSEAGAAFQGAEATGFWLVTGFTVLVAVSAAALLRRIGWI